MPELPDPDSIGPVDIAVIVFPGNEFNGDIAPALAELHDSGTVRVLDLAFAIKDAAGEISFIEVEDADVADAYEAVHGRDFDLLNDEDLDGIASQLEPDSSALVVVWENSWAARLAASVRDSNGRVAAMIRIPRKNVLEAFQAGQD